MLINNFSGKSKNEYLEIIYLFNPITALSCSKLNLSVFYNLVNFAFYTKEGHILFYPLYILSISLTPQYFFLNTFFLIYHLLEKPRSRQRLITSILTIGVSISVIFCTTLYYNYLNYYSLKDNFPNLNIHWALITSVSYHSLI
jgi:hypothetical protein